MTRARATALALVNWKGVFYERYLFDRHVTALEGANGAGKTTVMIAAYVVLLPDMSRLRFTNLGESSATGGDRGIWGRLGEIGRPSYAALEIEVGSRKFIAGVHLERKGEPSIVLTPFLVRDLDLQGSLKELLLLSRGEHDEVPDLQELRANVARLEGKVDVFSTAKEYFAALFEHGITPLRLATDEDRNKLNEMLKTSMTGGISRALTSELRSFLLKEETGLSDTLSRMRGNLDACHRTRTEVSESRHLEHEISGIFDAGQAMFAASLAATRAGDKEAVVRLGEARAAEDEAARHVRALEADIAEAKRRHERFAARLAETKRLAFEAHVRAGKIARAESVSRRIGELRDELLRKADGAREARDAYDASTKAREARRVDRERARDAYDRAATGVGDLEKGLEELHRNAHAYRRVRSRLEEARTALGDGGLEEGAVPSMLERTRTRLEQLDLERSRIDRDCESIEVRQREYERAMRALGALGPPPALSAHEGARAVLARFADSRAQLERATDASSELVRASQLAEQQARVRAQALELGIEGSVATGSAPAEPPARSVQRHLDEAEAALRAAEDEMRAETGRGEEARRSMSLVRIACEELALRAEKWSDCVPRLEALETRRGAPLRTRDAIAAARSGLAAAADRERAALAGLKEQHEARLREASALEAAGGSFDAELMGLRDELDAELLANRFEELEPEQAAILQAQLGPLENALIVDNPGGAAAFLSKIPRQATSVFLVGAHAALGLDSKRAVRHGDDVFVEEPFGIRVTRVPERPSLGRRARERRAAELREEAERLEREIEASLARARGIDESNRDAEALAADGMVIEAGDPSDEVARAQKELESLRLLEDACRARANVARQRADDSRVRTSALRALLGEAYLLAPPDYAAHAAQLSNSLATLEASRDELRRTEGDRATLAELIDVLRSPPTVPARGAGEERTELEERRRELDRERDRLFAAVSALSEVAENQHAFRFFEAERALDEKRAIVPALEEQRANARTAWESEEHALRAVETAWEVAASVQQKADAEHMAVRAHHDRAAGELAAEGLDDVSEQAALDANRRVIELDSERKAVEQEERRLATEIALLEERCTQSRRAATGARERVAAVEQAALPARQDWARLERAAEDAGILQNASTSRGSASHRGRTSLDLWSEARSKGEVLVDRLRASRGNAESAAQIHALLHAPTTERAGHVYLDAWLAVRDVLKRCLPTQVADVEDPLEALQRLRDHLSLLEERLSRQETDLRGASEDVARGIDVRLRRAKSQVRRLNQSLAGIHFGNVVGIRVEMKRVDKMEQILRALREGEVQELLFQTTLPIEEALNEIFRRYGGGSGRTGGQRVLDYREYIELSVEIQRNSGASDGAPSWESASPTRLSTGEAIGVGAALMMVILTEWERDANLLHQKRETGSLRFLFLDEANRLSQDNLGVLFDLCQNLDLQLLIAAPEVARAEGNTTYRLVRRVDDAGREEVLVSGRRVKAAHAVRAAESAVDD